MALLFRNKFYNHVIFFWAATTTYSRLSLGAYFVSDVIGGMVSGILIGYLMYRLYVRLQAKLIINEIKEELQYPYPYSTKRINYLNSLIITCILLFVVFSGFIIRHLY